MAKCEWCDKDLFYEEVLKGNSTAFSIKHLGDTLDCCNNCFKDKLFLIIENAMTDRAKNFWERISKQ